MSTPVTIVAAPVFTLANCMAALTDMDMCDQVVGHVCFAGSKPSSNPLLRQKRFKQYKQAYDIKPKDQCDRDFWLEWYNGEQAPGSDRIERFEDEAAEEELGEEESDGDDEMELDDDVVEDSPAALLDGIVPASSEASAKTSYPAWFDKLSEQSRKLRMEEWAQMQIKAKKIEEKAAAEQAEKEAAHAKQLGDLSGEEVDADIDENTPIMSVEEAIGDNASIDSSINPDTPVEAVQEDDDDDGLAAAMAAALTPVPETPRQLSLAPSRKRSLSVDSADMAPEPQPKKAKRQNKCGKCFELGHIANNKRLCRMHPAYAGSQASAGPNTQENTFQGVNTSELNTSYDHVFAPVSRSIPPKQHTGAPPKSARATPASMEMQMEISHNEVTPASNTSIAPVDQVVYGPANPPPFDEKEALFRKIWPAKWMPTIKMGEAWVELVNKMVPDTLDEATVQWNVVRHRKQRARELQQTREQMEEQKRKAKADSDAWFATIVKEEQQKKVIAQAKAVGAIEINDDAQEPSAQRHMLAPVQPQRMVQVTHSNQAATPLGVVRTSVIPQQATPLQALHKLLERLHKETGQTVRVVRMNIAVRNHLDKVSANSTDADARASLSNLKHNMQMDYAKLEHLQKQESALINKLGSMLGNPSQFQNQPPRQQILVIRDIQKLILHLERMRRDLAQKQVSQQQALKTQDQRVQMAKQKADMEQRLKESAAESQRLRQQMVQPQMLQGLDYNDELLGNSIVSTAWNPNWDSWF